MAAMALSVSTILVNSLWGRPELFVNAVSILEAGQPHGRWHQNGPVA